MGNPENKVEKLKLRIRRLKAEIEMFNAKGNKAVKKHLISEGCRTLISRDLFMLDARC